MSIEKRIRMCLFIERLRERKELGEKLGIEDVSTFHGKRIYKEGERIC